MASLDRRDGKDRHCHASWIRPERDDRHLLGEHAFAGSPCTPWRLPTDTSPANGPTRGDRADAGHLVWIRLAQRDRRGIHRLSLSGDRRNARWPSVGRRRAC